MGRRTIVIVEDDQTIAHSLEARLRSEGFEVALAVDGPGGVETCRRLRPELVVLDLMLPGFDGIEACRRIQAERNVPVLMLTARDEETDVLVGLGVGADDYVTKPFSLREVVARIHAILRRADRGESPSAIVKAGDIEIDADRRQVRRTGELVHLTPLEFDLLQRLAADPGIVFTRARLLTEVWGYEDPFGQRTVDAHVGSLRRKLGAQVVRTVHGVGYALGDGES
ncbi:MAG TPA: response regulator transcription factor [Thermoleophilaceae bacterium]|jgi:DNA-binding response OmpR family regulator|nr:response regulator transcription factor [Thermoleophilaceae bacterium]